MRNIKYLILILLIPNFARLNPNENPLTKLNYSSSIITRVENGEIISSATAETISDKNIQFFKVYGLGYHKRNCKIAMRKMSLYENYPNYLSIIKKSTYDEKQQILNFLISPPILSFEIDISIKIARIKDEGKYPVHFTKGTFKDLNGNIELTNHQGKCLFEVTAEWSGPPSGISDTILKLFLEVIVKMGMENLFRISS